MCISKFMFLYVYMYPNGKKFFMFWFRFSFKACYNIRDQRESMQNELRCWRFCMIYPWSMPEHQWWCVWSSGVSRRWWWDVICWSVALLDLDPLRLRVCDLVTTDPDVAGAGLGVCSPQSGVQPSPAPAQHPTPHHNPVLQYSYLKGLKLNKMYLLNASEFQIQMGIVQECIMWRNKPSAKMSVYEHYYL